MQSGEETCAGPRHGHDMSIQSQRQVQLGLIQTNRSYYKGPRPSEAPDHKEIDNVSVVGGMEV